MTSRPQNLTRRSFCLCCIGAAAIQSSGWLSPREAYAKAGGVVDLMRSEAARIPIEIHRSGRGIDVLSGSGGNIAVQIGQDGTLLVDAGMTASQKRIREALVALGSHRIEGLINTHWHFDHADGNEWMHGEGARIFAHRNTHRHLLSAQRVDDWNFDFPPAPPGAIPHEIIDEGKTLEINGSTLRLEHIPSAHTDGDLTVTFAEAEVIHAGDIYWNGSYPFIDYSTGGTIDGVISAVERLWRSSADSTLIIPGHGGPISNRRELGEYRTMLVEARGAVAHLKQSGKSLEEIQAAQPMSGFDDKWGKFVIDARVFTWLVFQGV